MYFFLLKNNIHGLHLRPLLVWWKGTSERQGGYRCIRTIWPKSGSDPGHTHAFYLDVLIHLATEISDP